MTPIAAGKRPRQIPAEIDLKFDNRIAKPLQDLTVLEGFLFRSFRSCR